MHTNQEESRNDRYFLLLYLFCGHGSVIPFYLQTVIYGEHRILFQGVCQLINKTNGHPFDENDESLFEV